MKQRTLAADTQLAHLGRDPGRFDGAVNPPVYHASTILADSLALYEEPGRRYQKGAVVYGRFGTPTTQALEDAVATLEGGHDTVSLSSGLAAVATALLSFVAAGDHILVSDNVYLPTRRFCDGILARMGVATTYYDPAIGPAIGELITEKTCLIFLESPGSGTFEVQDLPALAEVAHERGVKVLLDSTWSAILYCKPLALGADISIQAGTKYLSGHADAMIGLITANEDCAPLVRRTAYELGQCAAPDDVYLALRGLRTLSVRLARHQDTGLKLAAWLNDRPEVDRVLHPALPDDPGHALWRRDFSGASGLFGVVLARPYPKDALAEMLEGMDLFGIGSSWGGFESLLIATYPENARTASAWQAPGPTLRVHAGLEDLDDLIADLEAGFARLNRASGDAP
ncbi:MAG: cystathionine beta-lyase [Pseudomonadota bacterium]